MVERIKAVQRAFWALVVVALIVLALAIPHRADRNALVVLNELQAFSASFERGQLEKTLLSHAAAQGTLGLDQVAAAIRGKALPTVTAASGATPLAPRVSVSLGTLSQIHALTEPGATVPLGMASVEGLARSLGWRLSRQQERAFELSALELTVQPCGDAALAREPEIDAARVAALAAGDALGAATKKHEQAEALHEQRRKWKASWKMILKANEGRLEALSAKGAAERAKKAADARYEKLAAEASTEGESPGCAQAVAKLRTLPGASGEARPFELSFPAAIELRAVPVPQLTGATFQEAHARGMWDELSGLAPAAATAHVRERFSWHYRYSDAGRIKVGGMTVLQLLPLLLLPCLIAVRRRTRGVGASYNPFDVPGTTVLPRVGLGNVTFNALALIVLPLAGCVLCAYSLLALSQAPVVPVACAMASVMLGLQSQIAIGELLELREAIERSHSHPPPAPTVS